VHAAVARYRADLVHLAGPFVLGASAGAAARRLRPPVVAVYATDMPAYARAYHTGLAGQAICWRRLRRIHNAADRTLAPSTATAAAGRLIRLASRVRETDGRQLSCR
jgi:phosphatidylinositol alpha 1,6-mannosyltransferase